MAENPVDLYDSHYGELEAAVYRAVREATYDVDLGQTSWMSGAECAEFCRWLGLRAGQDVLEIACGAGGTAAYIAREFGVSVLGVDINEAAIEAASRRAAADSAGAAGGLSFRVVDANGPLPFEDASFDALFCNDAFNHLRDRAAALAECYRVLRPGGRYLYTDPTVLTGSLSHIEIAERSAIGHYTFSAAGWNEALLEAAGFELALMSDRTASVARTARAWREARIRYGSELLAIEGERRFEDLQRFLAMVHTLAGERRLSRFVFLCQKPG